MIIPQQVRKPRSRGLTGLSRLQSCVEPGMRARPQQVEGPWVPGLGPGGGPGWLLGFLCSPLSCSQQTCGGWGESGVQG